eukprot:2257749-Rhodomonas_salina.1
MGRWGTRVPGYPGTSVRLSGQKKICSSHGGHPGTLGVVYQYMPVENTHILHIAYLHRASWCDSREGSTQSSIEIQPAARGLGGVLVRGQIRIQASSEEQSRPSQPALEVSVHPALLTTAGGDGR